MTATECAPSRALKGTSFSPHVTLGPPGCGKTSRLGAHLDVELASGVPATKIAFVTFTRAARREVLTRVGGRLGPDPCADRWFRTIHSAAFHLLDIGPDRIMNRRRWQEFGKTHAYEFSDPGEEHDDLDADPGEPPRRTPDDLLRYVYGWARNARL